METALQREPRQLTRRGQQSLRLLHKMQAHLERLQEDSGHWRVKRPGEAFDRLMLMLELT